MTIRLLLADDQAMVRGALATLLGLEPDMEVVAEVGSGDEVVAAARSSKPDVALVDVEMPGLDGIAATAAQLRAAVPACRVVILTTFGRPGYLRRAMEAGATGFLLKDAPATELADAIRRVARGQRVVDPALALTALSEGANPLSERATRGAGAVGDQRHGLGHRRSARPVRRDRAQPPVGRDPEDRRPEPRRGRAHRVGQGLARTRNGRVAPVGVGRSA